MSKSIKQQLEASNQERAYRFQEGVAAITLIKERSAEIDLLLQTLWDELTNSFGNIQEYCTLIAVGGYGREELHPYSDIDLLIISEPNSINPEHNSGIEKFITKLWDLGLQIGHSVRSIDECIEESKNDITVTTNLLEARWLAGSKLLYSRLESVMREDSIWPSDPFFIAKRSEQEERLNRHNGTAYNLEPNIKEGAGGLRDIQNIIWVTQRHFGSRKIRSLVEHNFLTVEECAYLEGGQERLWEIRFALHLIAGRAEERLLFEHQSELADHFGHLDNVDKRGVESFMHSYFRLIHSLSLLNEILLQLFEEKLLTPDAGGVLIAIDENFSLRSGYLTLQPNNGSEQSRFEENPTLILKLFLLLSQDSTIKGLTADTIRQIRSSLNSIDNNFRANPVNRELFLQFFKRPKGLTHQFRQMNRYGVLGAYLPEFEKIIGLMQYDLFHAYTVDEHTLFVVRNLRRLTVSEYRNEYPQLSKIILNIANPERLYIAALFHDIAKGRGGDHSKLGVEIVRNFCTQHQVEEDATTDICWLVENHLMMSSFAQRRDIDDPAEIHAFTQLITNQDRLELLYLLTVADIRATNPTLWNHWKESLLSRLYQYTTDALNRGLKEGDISKELESEHRERARQLIRINSDLNNSDLSSSKLKITDEKVEELWSTLDSDYFQKEDPDSISWHTESILGSSERPLVTLNPDSQQGGSEILIYSCDRQFLFPILVHAIESLGLDIQAAKINTTKDSYALDVFNVLNSRGGIISDSSEAEKIEKRLLREIESTTLLSQPVAFRKTRLQKHFHNESRVEFEQDRSNAQTILEIHTNDQPGVLSTICRTLMGCNIRIHGAKIATLGERVEDRFWVTHQDSSPLLDEKFNQKISKELRQELDPD